MPRTVFALLTLILVLSSSLARAEDFRAYDIEIALPWARATPVDQTTGSIFMKLSNTGDIADRLLRAASPLAGRVTLVPARPLAILPGETVFLGPSGVRLDMIGLTAPLVEGTTIPLTLSFERGGMVEVSAEVTAADALGPPAE